jgi:hypothetical protein
MRLFAFATVAFAAHISVAASAETALATVKALYAPYMKGSANADNLPDLRSPKLYTRRVGKLLAALEKSCKDAQDVCGPDFDFIVNGQDFDLTEFKVTETSAGADAARVDVSFKNMARPTKITFSMKNGDRGWVIDDLIAAKLGDDAGYKLDDVLKP